MRIVVTGRYGQVARSLEERARAHGTDLIVIGRPIVDLARPATIWPAFAAAKPDIVVSAAAYTAVDPAEDEPDLAFAINSEGAGHVAAAAAKLGVPVLHLSTDYVFDGESQLPYAETDPTNPRCVYGASKFSGEQAVATANSNHLILRTAWVFSPYGHNFVKTVLRLAGERDQLSIVSDQIGNPTSALDIADAILTAIPILRNGQNRASLYHLTGAGEASWYDFAREIVKVSGAMGGPVAEVVPIRSNEYPTRALRPKNSRLDCSRFSEDFGYRPPDWKPSVQAVVGRLLAETRSQ